MKKILTMILALAMMLSLAACGEKKVTLEILDTEYAIEDYAICIAKENTELLDKINAALVELEAEGFFDELAVKYFGGEAEEAPAEEAAAETTEAAAE